MALYTLSVVNNSVVVLNDTGYYGAWQGFGVITVRRIEDTQAWFSIVINGLFEVQIRQDQFSTIGGQPPAGTIVGILQQLADLFSDAYPTGGGGGGTASFIQMTAVTPGSSITNAGLVGKTLYAVIINDVINNTGFSQPNGSGTVTFTNGVTFAGGETVTFLIN